MSARTIPAAELCHGDIEVLQDGWAQRRLANPRPVNDQHGNPAYIMVDLPDRTAAIYPADRQIEVFRA